MRIQITSDTCEPLHDGYTYEAKMGSVWNKFEKVMETCYIVDDYYVVPANKAIKIEDSEETS